jgi:hypothetical protein
MITYHLEKGLEKIPETLFISSIPQMIDNVQHSIRFI